MATLRVKDKIGLGRLVLLAATDEKTAERLFSNPVEVLRPFIENVPDGHTVKVVREEPGVTYLVIPSKENVPGSVEDKEEIIREEGQEYDQAKQNVEKSKKREPGGRSSLPTDVVEETYALMIGHTALSQSSRPQIRRKL
jgi:hypothetical protein